MLQLNRKEGPFEHLADLDGIRYPFFFLLKRRVHKKNPKNQNKKHCDRQQYQFFWGGAFTFWPAYKQSCAFSEN